MGDERFRTRCVCGWEAIGTADEVVAATLDHGRAIHNMEGTPEAVLQQAERLGPADGTSAAAPGSAAS